MTLQELMDEVDHWQRKQFGHDEFNYNRTIVAMLCHLEDEIGELKSAADTFWVNPNKREPKNSPDIGSDEIREEFADCFMLIIGAAAKFGLTAEELIEDTYTKLQHNKNKQWGEPDERRVVNHIKK